MNTEPHYSDSRWQPVRIQPPQQDSQRSGTSAMYPIAISLPEEDDMGEPSNPAPRTSLRWSDENQIQFQYLSLDDAISDHSEEPEHRDDREALEQPPSPTLSSPSFYEPEFEPEPKLLNERVSTPWSQKMILSIDGGGVRGYSSLIILRALMTEIRRKERDLGNRSRSSVDSPLLRDIELETKDVYLPCHYFDYMAGTSFGGYLSIMLGRLHMSVDQCIKDFLKLSPMIDKDPSLLQAIPSSLLPRRHRQWADNDALCGPLVEEMTAPALSAAEPRYDFRSFESNPKQCQTMALCLRFDGRKGDIYQFCSFKRGPKDGDSRSRMTVADVAKAITTPPISFKPTELRNESYVDGSVCIRNPSYEAWSEITSLQRRGKDSVDFLLSLGTGEHRRAVTDMYTSTALFLMDQKFKAKVISSKEVDKMLSKEADQNSSFRYRRFEVHGFSEPRRPTESALQHIERVTEGWLKSSENRKKLAYCANFLVRRRRARAQTRPWEAFALNMRYFCRWREDHGSFPNRRKLYDHLMSEHYVEMANYSLEDIEQELERSRDYEVDDKSEIDKFRFRPASLRMYPISGQSPPRIFLSQSPPASSYSPGS